MQLPRTIRNGKAIWSTVAVHLLLFSPILWAQSPGMLPEAAPQGELRQGRELLMSKNFAGALGVFSGYLKAHPDAIQARLGLGDAQLGMRQYEAAEMTYRAVVAQQPELWQAHKNLVVVEAALGRWEDFDRERTILRMARERSAPGISPRESDVIDSFSVAGQHWVVRAYFEPLGRSEARYNFERFSPEGRVEAYISLEDAAAAEAALKPEDVRIGAKETAPPANSNAAKPLSLNWYTGSAHGTVCGYPSGEPTYEHLRTDVIHWVRAHPDPTGKAPRHGMETQSSRGDAPAPKPQR